MRRLVKQFLAAGCYYCGLSQLLAAFRPKSGSTEQYLILMYHRVVDDMGAGTEYTQPGIAVSTRSFERQIAFLSRRYTILPLRQLADRLRSGTAIPPRTVVITFDDGWRDNFTLAYPILRKYNAPATIFVSTDFIETNQKFWFLRMGYYLTEGKLAVGQLADILEELFGGTSGGHREQPLTRDYLEWLASDHDRFIEALKDLDGSGMKRAIALLVNRTGLTDDKWPDRRWTLSWEEMKGMDPSLIEIGSHGLSHQILTTMTPAEIRRELVDSKLLIEERTGRPVTSIAYPNGNHDEAIRRLTKEAGYTCGIATHAPAGTALTRDIYALQRIGVHEGVSSGALGGFSPALFSCYLKRLF
jgi:peptidoglycan/xylan/chitin deacetylase (PgdA/CDA1 family)